MNEINVDISVCKNGDILAEDILNEGGTIAAGCNTKLNDFIISKIKAIGIETLWIYKDVSKKNVQENNKKFISITFGSNIESVIRIKAMIVALAGYKQLEYGVVRQLTDVICEKNTYADCLMEYFHELYIYDDYTYSHSVHVAFYAMLIGKWIHMSESEILEVIQAGLLHDIGKVKIPKDILNKKNKLTDTEFMIMKQHSYRGYELLKDSDMVSDSVKEAVLTHHERNDGSGYPAALTDINISKYAKIIAIADVYDAMTSNRPYKRGVTPFEVFDMFTTMETSTFEASIVIPFLQNISSHLIGAKVKLSNGEIGEVVYIPFNNMGKPIVCINFSYMEISPNSNPHIVCFL